MSVSVYIADSNYLIRQGIKAMVAQHKDIKVVAEADNSTDLISEVVAVNPDVVILDYCSPFFKVEDIQTILNINPDVHVLAITDMHDKEIIANALKAGVSGHILKDCDRQEILDAITSTAKGDNFYCGKILDAIKEEEYQNNNPSCAPISLSSRELEIIGHIAEGQTNKEIADKLCLSTHTIMTHRKNIMNKLGINNTAGIVIYAVKENIISPNKYLFSAAE